MPNLLQPSLSLALALDLLLIVSVWTGHDRDYYYPRSSSRKEDGKRPDYDSRVLVERRSSYRDDYYYSSSERVYSSRHAQPSTYGYKEDLRSSLSYRESHGREYDRGRSLKHQYIEIVSI
jgi:hypothetical protein